MALNNNLFNLFALPGHGWRSKVPEGCKALNRYQDQFLIEKVSKLTSSKPSPKVGQNTPKRYFETRSYICALAIAANHDDVSAASRLLYITELCSRELSILAEKKPELLHPISLEKLNWPVLRSPFPQINGNETALFAKLRLGQDLPFKLSKDSKWKNDAAGKIAVNLLLHLWRSRAGNRVEGIDISGIGQAADRLPMFSKETANRWWLTAKAVLLFSYPEPENTPELTKIIRDTSLAPSKVRTAILKLLEKRFLQLA